MTVFGALHVPQSTSDTSVPYVGVNLGANLSGGGGLAVGAEGGLKQFFLPGGALTVAAFLNTNSGLDAVTLGVGAGVSIFLG